MTKKPEEPPRRKRTNVKSLKTLNANKSAAKAAQETNLNNETSTSIEDSLSNLSLRDGGLKSVKSILMKKKTQRSESIFKRDKRNPRRAVSFSDEPQIKLIPSRIELEEMEKKRKRQRLRRKLTLRHVSRHVKSKPRSPNSSSMPRISRRRSRRNSMSGSSSTSSSSSPPSPPPKPKRKHRGRLSRARRKYNRDIKNKQRHKKFLKKPAHRRKKQRDRSPSQNDDDNRSPENN